MKFHNDDGRLDGGAEMYESNRGKKRGKRNKESSYCGKNER